MFSGDTEGLKAINLIERKLFVWLVSNLERLVLAIYLCLYVKAEIETKDGGKG